MFTMLAILANPISTKQTQNRAEPMQACSHNTKYWTKQNFDQWIKVHHQSPKTFRSKPQMLSSWCDQRKGNHSHWVLVLGTSAGKYTKAFMQ